MGRNRKRSGVHFYFINWSWSICQITRTLTIQQSLCHDFFKFRDFLTLRADCARLRDHRILKQVLLKLQFFISERQPVIFTLFSKSDDLAVSHNPLSKSKKCEIKKIMAQAFFNCEFQSLYDWKTAARPFDTIHDILRSLTLAQSLLKGRNAPILGIWNRGVNGFVIFHLKVS